MSKPKVNVQKLWGSFAQKEALTDKQVKQFEWYCQRLLSENENINLTAITTLPGVIRHHFQDSLSLGHNYDMNAVESMADVGTGAGFPAIPLKIKYPHLKILLIDMNKKRQDFLKKMCDELELDNMQICEYDWRTFIRVTEGEIDLFTARASLSPKELCRVFKPTSAYKKADLIYWASDQWESDKAEAAYMREAWSYRIGSRTRKLVKFTAE